MRVFISGPITGVENYERNFEVRAANLRAMGFQVENPVKIGKTLESMFPDRKITHEEYMTQTLATLLNCDGISMLDGWEDSIGCKTEYEVAVATGKTFVRAKLLDPSWNKV